jgi:hypothetical protein
MDERRSAVSRFCRRYVGAVYYWLDLVDTTGRPSFTKVFAGLTQLVLLVGVVMFGARVVENERTLTSGFLLYVAMVLVAPYGLNGLKTLLKIRFGGNEAAGSVARGDAPGSSGDSA